MCALLNKLVEAVNVAGGGTNALETDLEILRRRRDRLAQTCSATVPAL
jgi:hypothetical protein